MRKVYLYKLNLDHSHLFSRLSLVRVRGAAGKIEDALNQLLLGRLDRLDHGAFAHQREYVVLGDRLFFSHRGGSGTAPPSEQASPVFRVTPLGQAHR